MKIPKIVPGDGILAQSKRLDVFTNEITKADIIKALKGRQFDITVKRIKIKR